MQAALTFDGMPYANMCRVATRKGRTAKEGPHSKEGPRRWCVLQPYQMYMHAVHQGTHPVYELTLCCCQVGTDFDGCVVHAGVPLGVHLPDVILHTNGQTAVYGHMASLIVDRPGHAAPG
jgi:hypothetical protein